MLHTLNPTQWSLTWQGCQKSSNVIYWGRDVSEREKKRILTRCHVKCEVLCSPLSCSSRPEQVWLSEPTGMQLKHQSKPVSLLKLAWSSFKAQEVKSRRYMFHHSQQYATLSALKKLITKQARTCTKLESAGAGVSLPPILTCSNPTQQPDFWMRLWKAGAHPAEEGWAPGAALPRHMVLPRDTEAVHWICKDSWLRFSECSPWTFVDLPGALFHFVLLHLAVAAFSQNDHFHKALLFYFHDLCTVQP